MAGICLYNNRINPLHKLKAQLSLSYTEVAIKQYDATELGTICIYTNGSYINNHIGAAIIAPVIQISGIHTIRKKYMGISTTSIVYAAELRGLVLVLQILLDIHITVITPGKYTIFIDNQAAI